MADETTTAGTSDEAVAASSTAVEVKPVVTYTVVAPIVHGTAGREPKAYGVGDEFRSSDATEAEIAALRAAGCLKLANELQAPEEVADQIARAEAENAALRAELEALRAAQASSGKGSK